MHEAGPPAEPAIRPATVTAYVGLGANLGDARAAVAGAIAELGRLPRTTLLRQADFINHVAPHRLAGQTEGFPPMRELLVQLTHQGTQAQEVETSPEARLLDERERR